MTKIILIGLLSSVLVGSAQVVEEEWKFFCERFDVAIVEGELFPKVEKKGGTFRVDTNFFGLIESEGTLSVAVHRFRVDKIYSASSVFTGNPKENREMLVMVEYLEVQEVLVPTMKTGKGVFLLMWSPLSLAPTAKIVARLNKEDVQRAMAARLVWAESRRSTIQEEIESFTEKGVR